MLNAKQFLKLTIDEHANASSSSSTSTVSNCSSQATPSMTLHESCFTPATPYNIADGQILDLFPCTESPANLEPMTHNNSQYLSRLSLSSVPSNNPQLAANDNSATSSIQSIISEASNRRRRSSNRSRSNTISLNFSETALTPNFAATAERPNAFFPPDEFSLETVNTSTPENKDEICEDSKTASKLQKMTDEPLTEISPRKTKENQSIGTVNQHGKKQSVVMDGSVTANTDNQQHPPLKGAQEDSKEDEKSDQPEPVATGRNPSNDGNGGGDNDDDDAKAESSAIRNMRGFPLILICCYSPATVFRIWGLIDDSYGGHNTLVLRCITFAGITLTGFFDGILYGCLRRSRKPKSADMVDANATRERPEGSTETGERHSEMMQYPYDHEEESHPHADPQVCFVSNAQYRYASVTVEEDEEGEDI
mmetsp:Transcript_24683/g.39152  ORF Transcript_24683/g.39152 Transcript_24683/m.39152 type:complete len:423 (-) Transcript_24683:185-1453(-)